MRCSCFTPLFLLALAAALPAQEPLITPETPVDSGTLHQWLHSGDPRLIAWAADFARRRHDAKILAEMPELLAHSTMPLAYTYAGDEPPPAEGDAIGAVLDALIQENAQVPIRAIKVVASFFPAQASILIGRLPLTQSRLTLEEWTYGATGTWGGRILARIASMMLAKDPGPSRGIWNGNFMGFVASVVAASEEELQITVSSQNAEAGLGGSAKCGLSLGSEVPPGWPEIYTCYLVENDSDASAPLVVDLDGNRIAFHRVEEHRGWGSCRGGVDGLNPSTRHRLIAHWLGTQDKEMSWQAVERFTIVWTDKAAYQRQLGEIIESQREKLHATVEAFYQRGLLTEGEAATYAPRLVVTIRCEIEPCPVP
jgi:hypothetical protein